MLLILIIEKCERNIKRCMELLKSLGFIIHPKKFFPIRCSDYLCFVLNSEDMSIFLSGVKKEKIKLLCLEILKAESPTIRTVAKLLGKFTSNFPTV